MEQVTIKSLSSLIQDLVQAHQDIERVKLIVNLRLHKQQTIGTHTYSQK